MDAGGRALGVAGLALVLAGCGPNESGPGTLPPEEHREILIASTATGGGNLAVDFDFEAQPILVSFVGTFGELDFFTGNEPGFEALLEPEDDLFVLDDGTPIGLELIANDGVARLRFEDEILENPGDTVVIGSTPTLDGHGEWQLLLPAGEREGDFHLTFKVTTTAAQYGDSEPVTATLRVAEP
jgi:hypothetical protein